MHFITHPTSGLLQAIQHFLSARAHRRHSPLFDPRNLLTTRLLRAPWCRAVMLAAEGV